MSLSPENVSAYLRRLGFQGPTSPDVETLRAIHRRHLESIPFENLDIHLGRPLRLEQGALFEKIVRRRRGGICYELNGLFASRLTAIGFRVDLLSARIAHSAGEPGPEFDHLCQTLRDHFGIELDDSFPLGSLR
jgi:N-hydroxyarylamine O-acetyltransferase